MSVHLSLRVFPSKYPSITPVKISNTPRWLFGPLKDNQWGGCRLYPQKSRRELFQLIFSLWIFLGRGDSICRHSIDCCFVSGSYWYNHVFFPWSPITSDKKLFGSCRKNSKCFSHEWHRWSFWSAFRHFRTDYTDISHMSRSSWMMYPTRSREMPHCSAIDLAKIRQSSKITSWIWSIISGVVTVLGRPGRGASQVEELPRLN